MQLRSASLAAVLEALPCLATVNGTSAAVFHGLGYLGSSPFPNYRPWCREQEKGLTPIRTCALAA
jgi:hypothetical protein